MRNLMTFKLFEESSNHGYSLEDIKELPGYMLLLAVGYYDSSSEVIKKHMNMRLYNDELEMDTNSDNVMVYANGYVRRISPSQFIGGVGSIGKPHIMKHFDGPDTLARWNDQFMYIYDWTLKQYKKKSIDSKYKGIDKSDFTSGESAMQYMVKSYAGDPASIFNMYDSLDEPNRKKFIKGIKTSQKDFDDEKKKYEFSMNIVKNWV